MLEGSQKADPRRIWLNGSKGPKRQRKIGSGKQESPRTTTSESNWRKRNLCRSTGKDRKSTKVGACQLKGFPRPCCHRWFFAVSRVIYVRPFATGGSLLGVLGRWGAHGWSVVQLDHDEEMGAELEVQRTIKRAELTTSLCFLRKANGPTVVHVGNKGIIDELWRGETRCIGPEAMDADLWILIWEELHRVHQEESSGRSRRRK